MLKILPYKLLPRKYINKLNINFFSSKAEENLDSSIKIKKQIDKIIEERKSEMTPEQKVDFQLQQMHNKDPERIEILKEALDSRNDYDFQGQYQNTNHIEEIYENELVNTFIKHIKTHEYLSLHEYFIKSLTHNKHGYYMKNKQKIGTDKEQSDFITAPECSSLFGELLGNFYLYQYYIGLNFKYKLSHDNHNLNGSLFETLDEWTIVEIGGGTGINACNILNSIIKQDIKSFKKLKLIMIDKSPYFRQTQLNSLKKFLKQQYNLYIQPGENLEYSNDKNAENYEIVKDTNNALSIDNTFSIQFLSDFRSFRIDYDSYLIQNVKQQGLVNPINLDKFYKQETKEFDEEGIKSLTKELEKEYTPDQALLIHQNIENKAREDGPIFFVLNEVFDALPAYRLVWTGSEWQEVVVVLNDYKQRLNGNYFKLEHRKTPICDMLMKKSVNVNSGNKNAEDINEMDIKTINLYEDVYKNLDQNSMIERSVQGCEFMADLCRFNYLRGGGSLIIDYGAAHAFSDSIRGIRNHKFVDDWLNNPGECDLSIYVDFKLLSHIVLNYFGENLNVYGPIRQCLFFEGLGINNLWQLMKQQMTETEIEQMKIGLNKILSLDEMGDTYKVMYVSSNDYSGKQETLYTYPFNEMMQVTDYMMKDYKPIL